MRRLPPVLGILAGALLGAVVPLLFSQMNTFTADVVEPSVQVRDGERTAMVRWEGPHGAKVQRLVIPSAYADASEVPVARTREGYRVGPVPDTADWLAILGGSGIGAALGGVAVASLAGWGYVKGRGEYGTTSRAGLSEGRGFYWRS